MQGIADSGQRSDQSRNTHDAIRDTNFTGVSIDSRTVKAGECFFAIKGQNYDGHDFVGQAFDKGAACAVVSSRIKNKNLTGKGILLVRDTIEALGDFAREYRKEIGFKVVAVTGSVGKTTTRQIIFKVLSVHFKVHQSPGSFNNNIGLPLTLLGAGSEDKIVAVELGSNHPGEISYLTHIARPDIAVVTNIHLSHLEGFGNLETVAKEKLSISEGLADDGILIINADCERLVRHCRADGIRFLSFGRSEGSDYRAENIRYEGPASRFTLEGQETYLPLPGPGNVENATAAWAVCKQFGLTVNDFARSLETLPALTGRAELMQIGTLTVLNDCYNANPASMKNALEILAVIGSDKKRRQVFICGDMAELGNQAEALHIELGKSIAVAKVELLLVAGGLSRIAAESAKASAEYDIQIKCFDDTISACDNLHEFIRDYDIILVKGSRTAGLELAVEKLKELYKNKHEARNSKSETNTNSKSSKPKI